MRLNVGMLGAEQRFGTLDRQALDHIDAFATAIITGARISFRIFVGQYRTLRLKHRRTDEVFRRDQLDLVVLARRLARDGLGDFRILPGKNAHFVSSK